MTALESIISLLILGILILFLNPTHLLMPDSVNAMLILSLIILFLVFTGLIWKEKPGDEREAIHIQKAGRASFLVGSAILVTGIISQAQKHNIDPWLIYTLSAMVLTKTITRIYNKLKN